MNLIDFLRTTPLEKSLLIGYYGGGNYGDELLLEVLQNLLAQQDTKDVVVTYRSPEHYKDYHHDFGYRRVEVQDKKAVARAIRTNKHILVGGGGLWGVDMNFNTFLLSLSLFVSRWFLGKKVYLLGVGYYDSTTRLGRAGAWLAGKAANLILARDTETHHNFQKTNRHTHLDTDIAWYIKHINLKAYRDEAARLDKKLKVRGKTLFITLRRPQAKHRQQDFVQLSQTVADCIEANQERHIIAALLESKTKAPDDYKLVRAWQKQYKHVQALDIPCNPLALFLFFRKHRRTLAVIGPQFHIIITAYLTGVPFLPVVYDNKVDGLLHTIGVDVDKRIPVARLTAADMQTFINNFYTKGHA